MTPRRTGILAFEGVDLLDLGGPYEVFLTASRLAVRAGEPPPFEDVPALAARLGSARGRADVPWVDATDVVTSGGLSAGIAMALHLVDRLSGRDLAERTARQLDDAWDAAPG